MKKLLALGLITVMTTVCVACGGNTSEQGSEAASQDAQASEVTSEENEAVAIADANEILTKAWAEYNATVSEDLQFPVGGGNVESMVMDGPGKFDVTVEAAQDTLTASYCATPEFVAKTDDVATMMNMMMANNFTAAAYHITDAANVDAGIAELKDATLNNQWMCGMPETFIVVKVGDSYLVSVFGNGQVVEAFKTALTTVYGDAAVVSVEESLM